MKCAIMQPTYLPWSGYFNLIASVDQFVFLDDVQFERQSWQSRNRILLQGREHLLVVPVERAPLTTPISKIVTSQRRENWRATHWKTLKSAYSKCRYGSELLELLKPFYTEDLNNTGLAYWNSRIIEGIANALSLETAFLWSSCLGCGGNRSQRLIAICETLGVDIYLSPRGAQDYLEDDCFCRATQVSLEYQAYTPRAYSQYKINSFISHLSIVDVIANLGFEGTRAYVSEPATSR